MKYALGLIFLLLSSSVFAESNLLILRGRVPASYRVEVDQQNHKPYKHFKKSKKHRRHWKIISNDRKSHGGPRLSVKLYKNRYLVSLTIP